ncbi:MAG TPA: hypothetical protein VEN28_00960, partial [Burkholderiaceae bacterium]|nr:hypothetical protein [Burkholderiaceae bacterium]
TADLLHAMQALSQLSYTPTRKGAHYSHRLDRRNRAALRNRADAPSARPRAQISTKNVRDL